MPDQKNLVLAIVLSFLIIFGFSYLNPPPEPPPQQASTSQQAGTGAGTGEPLVGVDLPGEPVAQAVTRDEALEGSARIRIDTPRLHGSLSLVGGRIDDLTLADYRETVDPESDEIVLLSPRNAPKPYYADFGWAASGGVAVPGPDTEWSADGEILTVDQPITLRWNNGDGLVFERIVSVDADYMFTITQRVTNNGEGAVSVSPYSRVQRFDTPETLGFYILHEGPYGVFEETLQEHDYDELVDDGEVREESVGGWLGFTDKYWLVALVPDQEAAFTGLFAHRDSSGRDRYLATMQRTDAETVIPGAGFEQTSHLYAGAKVVQTIEGYGDTLGIQRFDLTIDWGWFHFLTRPFFYALAYINGLVGNFGVAILILTVGIKLVLFPLANKSYRAMAKMKALAPEMQKLKERFGEDRQKLNQEMMALYKREKANPAAGCLPILVQIPVFFALYKVLFVTIEMRHAPFFGWIQDLSARDPTSIFNLFGLLPFTPPEILLIGAWPLIMGLTMWLQQKLNPAPTDPIQQKIFTFLPIIFTIMLAAFPAGLVIYWAWNNALSIVQQYVIMRAAGVKIGGGVVTPTPPTPPTNGKASAGESGDSAEDAEVRALSNGEAGDGAEPAKAEANEDGEAPEVKSPPPQRRSSAKRRGAKGRRSASRRRS